MVSIWFYIKVIMLLSKALPALMVRSVLSLYRNPCCSAYILQHISV
ncbi:hypothetical protein AB205_0093130 [Aquarana catesbeiana]|uniref:Uncharacterized protein n=1 Tax=Aquarana catesbeiana TaxID=8400 RepID=A0A2G9QIQ2_AQUCT|nr:hypothetical protein AB205_0093130 [Aquarana catesbeiana]